MGLILAPLLLFWIGSAIFSLRVGYVILNGKELFPFITAVLVIAIISTLAYVLIGLYTFKGRQEVWHFEIPFFFFTNKIALSLYAVSFLLYFLGGSLLNIKYVGPAIFVVIFALSFGAIIGTVNSGKFINKYDIKTTY